MVLAVAMLAGTEANAAAVHATRQRVVLLADQRFSPGTLYNLAISLENSDPAEATGRYKKIVAINPQASTAYLRLAFVYAEQGELGDAQAAQAKAVAIDPALGKYPLPAARG